MRTQLAAACVDDRSGADGQPGSKVVGGLTPGHEADLLALGFVGNGKHELARVFAHVPLGHPAQWKEDAGEAVAVEVVQHVGLVLGCVDRCMQLGTVGALHDARVVPGREPVESKLDHPREHQVETHQRVAAHARVGGTAFQVRPVKGLDHPLAELLLQVPAVIRNVEERGHAAGILDRG